MDVAGRKGVSKSELVDSDCPYRPYRPYRPLSAYRPYSIATSASSSTFSAYNALGNVLNSSQTTGGTAYPFVYTYNLAGSLLTEAYPSGRTVTTAYDTANRELTISGSYHGTTPMYFSGIPNTNGIQYEPWGAYASYAIGNPANLATRSYSYNNRMQPSDQSTQVIFWKPLDLGYGFGSTTDNGNLMSLTENVYPPGASGGTPANSFPATYTYDNVNRLSTATESGSGGWYEDFSYDQFGNMWVNSSSSNLSIGASTPTTSSFYNTANNHFTAVNYDSAGNQTSKLYPTTSTFAYDAESRQNSTYSSTNGTSTYAYSGDGHRVTKVALGATITYVYDALGRLAAEYSTAAGVPDCTTCYIADDHLGDTRMVLDESANVVSRHDYEPFGNEVPVVNGRTSVWGATDAVNQKFTGKERDLETNFDYFGARYYGFLQGRFTSPDWSAKAEAIPYADLSNPQSLNLYGYVKNNPASGRDPDGHDALWVVDKKTGQTTLVIPVHITGSGATSDAISTIVNRDNTLNTGGSPVKVQVIETDTPVNGVLNQMNFSPGYDYANYPVAGEGVNTMGGNQSHINSANGDGTDAAAHDVLHFAGVKDQYQEGQRDAQGNRTSTPTPGYDNSNIMTSRSGTDLKPGQIQEAQKNKTTKQCTTDNGKTSCK